MLYLTQERPKKYLLSFKLTDLAAEWLSHDINIGLRPGTWYVSNTGPGIDVSRHWDTFSNINSIRIYNIRRQVPFPEKLESSIRKLRDLRTLITKGFTPLERKQFIIVSGAALFPLGLRHPADIDIYVGNKVSHERVQEQLGHLRPLFLDEINQTEIRRRGYEHIMSYTGLNDSFETVIDNPKYFYTYRGLKYIIPEIEVSRRILRTTPKSWADLIELQTYFPRIAFPELPDVIIARVNVATWEYTKKQFIAEIVAKVATTYNRKMTVDEVLLAIAPSASEDQNQIFMEQQVVAKEHGTPIAVLTNKQKREIAGDMPFTMPKIVRAMVESKEELKKVSDEPQEPPQDTSRSTNKKTKGAKKIAKILKADDTLQMYENLYKSSKPN